MKKKKEWNKERKSEDFEEIFIPLHKFVKEALKDRTIKKDLEYNGYPLDLICGATSLGGHDLSKAEIRRNQSRNGRTVLEQMLQLAMQLGMEQGSRIFQENYNTEKDSYESTLRNVLKKLDDENYKKEYIKNDIESILSYFENKRKNKLT